MAVRIVDVKIKKYPARYKKISRWMQCEIQIYWNQLNQTTVVGKNDISRNRSIRGNLVSIRDNHLSCQKLGKIRELVAIKLLGRRSYGN